MVPRRKARVVLVLGEGGRKISHPLSWLKLTYYAGAETNPCERQDFAQANAMLLFLLYALTVRGRI